MFFRLADEMDLLLHGKARKFQMRIGSRAINLTYMGIIEKFNDSRLARSAPL